MEMPTTPGRQLRDLYTRDAPNKINTSDQQYMQRLQSLGVEANPCLYPAYFQLHNRLLYPGMATDRLLLKDEILVRVPEHLILSSMKALKQPALQQVYSDPFYHDESTWQDRILLTYVLFLLGTKPQGNIFYEMVLHMSKDIDLLLSWSDNQINSFVDGSIRKAALADRQSFEQQWQLFQECQARNPQLQAPEYNKQNYLWIFTHISSRCFGKNIDYTSFVPYCQFFNHHSSSVYYETNGITEQNVNGQGEIDELSSDGSNDSQDYIEDGEFDYHEVDKVYIKWSAKECYSLSKTERKAVQGIRVRLCDRVEKELDLKGFSILFAGYFLERAYLIESEYVAGRKKYPHTCTLYLDLQAILDKYLTLYQQSLPPSKTPANPPTQPFTRPNPHSYTPSYSTFHLKTGSSDTFLPHNQVYFCYGRNSNRSLLLRYGFAIEGNKYEHVWLSYDLRDKLRDWPDLMAKVEKLGLSLRRKFRVNWVKVNMDLVYFFRLRNWGLYGVSSVEQIFYVNNTREQMRVLEEIKQSLSLECQKYDQFEQSDLSNEKLSYHEYFIKVYHIEKKRILLRQIKYFQKLLEIITRLDQNQNLQDSTCHLNKAQHYIFRHYISSIRL